MHLKCSSFENMKEDILRRDARIVMFGAGAVGMVTAPVILEAHGLLQRVCCYVDNDSSRQGETLTVRGMSFPVKSPDTLRDLPPDKTVLLLNISRFEDVLRQLDAMSCTKDMSCYIMPMMCIHNFCLTPSAGEAQMSEKALIPKIIHYMWLGKKEIPARLQKCIDSWKRFCPEYEIIRWDEDNYDLAKHPYMAQAYEKGAYGFIPDVARLDLLYEHGGLYLDTDVEVIRSPDPLLCQEAFCGVEKWQIVNFGGCSGAVRGHPMVKAFLDARKDVFYLDADGRENRNTCGFYDTGVILEKGYRMDGSTQCIDGMNIYAYDFFHPYDYMSGQTNLTDHTYTIHHFDGGWQDEEMKLANSRTAAAYEELYQSAARDQSQSRS